MTDFVEAPFAYLSTGTRAIREGGLWRTNQGAILTCDEMEAKGWTPVWTTPELTMSTLRTAWDGASPVNPYDPPRKGDTLIVKRNGAYTVSVVTTEVYGIGPYQPIVRILSRAPERKPWKELAELIEDAATSSGMTEWESIAQRLHEAGVRVEGDDQ